MFKRYVIVAGLLMASSAWADNDLSTLKGYQGHFASPAFSALLEEDEEVFAYFEEHSVELQKVLADQNLQAKLVSGEITVDELTATLAKQQADALKPLPTDDRAARDLAQFSSQGSAQVAAAVSRGDSYRAARDLGSAARETKPVDQSTVDAVSTAKPPVPAAALPELADMNKIPEAGVDAKGWPKYLNVPAHCPEPKEGVRYKYESDQWFKLSGPDGVRRVPPRPQEEGGYAREIKHYLTGGGAHRWHRLADQEIYAVPFITPAVVRSKLIYPDDGITQSWSDQNPMVRPVTPVLAISECPGVLTADESQSFNRGAVVNGIGARVVTMAEYEAAQAEAEAVYARNQANPGLRHHGKGGVLKPGARYFLNMGYKTDTTCADDYASIGMSNHRKDDRGKAICGGFFSASGTGMLNAAPYTGPCLSFGPYPLNYNSITCQGSDYYKNATGEAGAGTIDLVNGSMKYRCFDPKGELAETRYEMKVVNGLVRWVQGGGKAAPARLVCAGSAEADWAALPIHEICSRTTEGYRQSIQVLSYGRYPVKRAITQCMKDSTQSNAYAWKSLVADDMGPMGVGGFMQASSNHMVITRYLDAEGNEITRHAQGDGRTGVGEGAVIDPRWDDPTVTTASLKPGQ